MCFLKCLAVSPCRMPALNRMVDVLLANVDRIYDLWGTFLSHVLELIGNEKAQIREAAIDALGRAITVALQSLGSPPNRSQDQDDVDSTGGLEHMLLVALEALHNDDREHNVQVGVLKVLLSVLQRNGEQLTDGWTPVFRLLAVVPEDASQETVSLGFESLQLIYNDYMASMPTDRIKKCLQVVQLYGSQQTDVNVSLTTISLLWNAGDMLSQRSLRSDSSASKEGSTSGDEETASVSRKMSDNFSSEIENLLDIVYTALYDLSRDSRPEVRNSAARTTFAIVVAHGARLSERLWTKCLWDMLFPLLQYSFHMSATSSKEEAEAALLGRSKGEKVRLVVHHSRNTEQKQWDETVVVCLGGMTRLLRTHMEHLCAMEGIEDGWAELMVVVESSLAGGRKEVALSAISLLGGVLGGYEGHANMSKTMWQRAMRAVDVGVVAATSSGCQVPLGARTELVTLVGNVYEANRLRFDRESTIAVYKWVESFCRNPWSEDDAANPVQPSGMPPVQKSALLLLPKLYPQHDESLWPEFLCVIADLIEPTHAIALLKIERQESSGVSHSSATKQYNSYNDNAANGSDPLPPPASAQYRFALNAAFLEKAMGHLVTLFEMAPLWARAKSLADITSVLGRCMEVCCMFTAFYSFIFCGQGRGTKSICAVRARV